MTLTDEQLDQAMTAALRALRMDEFERLATESDRRQADLARRLEQPGALQAAARWYAEQGLAVFPCQPGGKAPITRHGFQDATTDLDMIRGWWKTNPAANIGLPTGGRYDVIDVDGPPGYQSLADLRENGQLPSWAGRVATPRGGMHLYIEPTGDGNAAGFRPGLDYRGLGGYVIAPPSRGLGGRRWEWLNPLNTSGYQVVYTHEVAE